jgi:hypothetical protein
LHLFLISPTHGKYPIHVIFLDLIIITISGESTNYGLCSFLPAAITSPLLGPNIHFSIFFLASTTEVLHSHIEKCVICGMLLLKMCSQMQYSLPLHNLSSNSFSSLVHTSSLDSNFESYE